MLLFTFFNFLSVSNLHIFRMCEIVNLHFWLFLCVRSAKFFADNHSTYILRSTYIFTIYIYIYVLLICLPTTFFVVIWVEFNPVFLCDFIQKIWLKSQIVTYFINETRDVFVLYFLPKCNIRMRKSEAWTINR